MADAAQVQKSGSGGRALLWLVILVLLGAVWWLASERNERKYTLSARDGVLQISRGRFFPTGTAAIGPDDPEGKLYAGIALQAGPKTMPEVEYDDQGALDCALYDLLSATAHALAKKGDKASFTEADALAKRLSGLRGLTAEELGDLSGLRAELAFWSAGSDVQAAVNAIASARRKLEEVRANGGEHAPLAGPLSALLEPIAAELGELGARFAPPGGVVGVPTVGTPINSNVPAAVPPPSVASPPGAPSTNSIIPAEPPAAAPPAKPAETAPAPAVEAPAQGASAPGSVRSGESRAK